MNNLNQLELITAILDELSDQGVSFIDQEAMSVIIRNVDDLIKQLSVSPINNGISI